MTIAELYARTIEDLAELERARLRLLGRADALAELCDAGLGDTELPGTYPVGARHGLADAPEEE
jgi:hypothetical protein